MKLFRKYVSRSIADGKRAVSIKLENDVAILRSEKGVIDIFESEGKFYGISMNLQPIVIKASEKQIDESMRYFSFFPDEPKKTDDVEIKTDEETPSEKAKRPYVRRKA